MGIDIHAFIELTFDDGRVKFIGEADIGRRSTLYYLMGCYSHMGLAVFDPKGFPSDLSCETSSKYDARLWEGFGQSWLSLGELEEVRRRYIAGQRKVIETSAHAEGVKPIAQLGTGSVPESQSKALEESCAQEDEWHDEALDLLNIIETMQLLTVHGTPRLVFWFDN